MRYLKYLMRERLQRFRPLPAIADATQYRHAAVGLVVVDEGHGARVRGLEKPTAWSGNASLLLTRRPLTMRRHAGQWALPGGRLDAGETPQQAALRELHEEVGLCLPQSAILGRLDDFATRSGFIMSAFVIWGGRAAHLRADPQEVASIHRIRLTEFLRVDAPRLSPQSPAALATSSSTTAAAAAYHAPVLRMPVGDDHIAAPTAALIYQFRQVCLLGEATRVAHFDEPVFAWS